LVIIHNSNSNGNIKLPKKGEYKDSIRIPIFTVGKEKGENITALLPSAVGIYKPSATVQSAVATIDSTQIFVKNTLEKSPEGENTSLDTEEGNNALSSTRKGWFLSPNPTSDYATLAYNFSQATDVQVTILSATGQLMQTLTQKAAASGSFQIDVHNWASGVYTLRLQSGGKQEVKRLVVQH
jgi:Secretion system C-terminal sorting domain